MKLSKKLMGPIAGLLMTVASTGLFSKTTFANEQQIAPQQQVERIINEPLNLSRIEEQKFKILQDFLNSQQKEDIDKAMKTLQKNMPQILDLYQKNPRLFESYLESLYSLNIDILTNKKGFIDKSNLFSSRNEEIFQILEKIFNKKGIDFERNFSTGDYSMILLLVGFFFLASPKIKFE